MPTIAFLVCSGTTFRKYMAQKGNYLLHPSSPSPWTILSLLSLSRYIPWIKWHFLAQCLRGHVWEVQWQRGGILGSSELNPCKMQSLQNACNVSVSSTIIVSGQTSKNIIHCYIGEIKSSPVLFVEVGGFSSWCQQILYLPQ